jgi:hypothetical protein
VTLAAAQPVERMPVRFADVDRYRACTLCDHGPGRGGPAGCCTLSPRHPEATHMRIGGWDLS